ncbi:ABC transporter ATP-binding protein [Verrucosispora sp. WMMA2121]|uniref:ABC transporter ATP-binding protein n=1 Tax=Verrucosispora sp. WMMA2121 TaxID=3015164 RepID=UPI0022B65A76|nr:ABC transporter ATP-binding protein [Verrucosispora sp. WMMA2121]MCZ7422140.1 ABC transporter ATP-binding protein [Verrucosispora sp. WMMA2121]
MTDQLLARRSEPEAGKNTLLEVCDVGIRFGGLRALHDVSFTVGRDQVVGLIGPNGAGKTTLFNVITRAYRADTGSVRFDGVDLLTRPAHQIAQLGVARTFQNLGLVPALDVRGNVLLGANARSRHGVISAGIGFARTARREREARERTEIVLRDLGLAQVASLRPDALPFGTLKRIELARAIAAEPSLLMLDEPANGLSAAEVDELSDLIRTLRRTYRLTILLVEHNMRMVMDLSDHIVVLNFGQVLAQGTPAEIRSDDAVVSAYLGESSARDGGTS